ncbi:hypothetical protein ACTXT7_007698 [Hymenolepis weldensis]
MKILRFFVHEAGVTSLCPYDANPYLSKRVYRLSLFITVPFNYKCTCTYVLTRVLAQVTRINRLCITTHTHADTPVVCLLLDFLIAFDPYLSLTRLNPHRGYLNTFWPNQLLVFWSVTVVAVVSC